MDWKQAREAERAALESMVALFLALAGLAERAGSRSRPVRAFVLCILRHAEVIARDWVTGTPAPMRPCHAGNFNDAMLLARDFRELACELLSQAALAFAADDAGDSLLFRVEAAAVQTSGQRKSKLSPGAARDRFDAPGLHPAPDTS